ncbi:hypothetical protein [Lysobacter sp. CA199]|uniref:hypothetical protein n=1 Tax=Lysobacter sp. CA199 TaxID=3455608 RepID=UPI003F8D2A47
MKQIGRAVMVAAVFVTPLNALAGFEPSPLPPQAQHSEDVPVEIATVAVEQKRVRRSGMVALGNDSTFYIQVGGGSLLTGLLLGPAGVAMNMHNVKKRTEREAAGASAGPPDVRALLSAPIGAYNAAAKGAAVAKITPYFVYVRPKKSDQVYGRLSLDIDYAGWTGRYSYHYAPVSFEQFQAGRSEEQTRAFVAETEQATAQLLRLFNAEARRQTGPVESALVSSWPLNPAFEAPLPLGLRGQFEGRPVLVGQGTPADHKALLSLMVGAHLMPADEFVVDKRKGEVPQR